MARTAMQEQFGDVIDTAIGGDYALRLPAGYPGCVRFYVLRPSGSVNVTLPVAVYCRMGGIPSFTIANINGGGSTLTVKGVLGTTIGTIPANAVAHVYCVNTDSVEGIWTMRTFSGAVVGAVGEPPGLVAFTVEVGTTQQYNLRDYVDANLDYDGVSVAYVTCNVNGVIGSDNPYVPAFYTGAWPAGSIVHLNIGLGSYIAGKGGDGGRGGDKVGLLAQNGGPGGIGMWIRANTTLVNNGTIMGGGGGGAATAHDGPYGGQGGGGGAGRPGGRGGDGGTGDGGANGIAGGVGSLIQGGIGGHGVYGTTTPFIAGNGGGPGTAGLTTSSTSSIPGTAGDAIQVYTGFTLTKTVAGTILGAETTL